MFKFEELQIWKASIDFAAKIYRITKAFPAEERFGLTQQLRNAAVSISLNMAEGSGRYHNRDFLRFVQIAIGSLYEVVSGFFIAENEGYVGETEFRMVYAEAEKIAKMINSFIAYLRKTQSPAPGKS